MRGAWRLILVTAVSGFLAAGSTGLLEAILQWANQGPLPGPFPSAWSYVRPLRMLLPHVILYGAAGALLALLALAPAALAARRASGRQAAAASLAAAGAGAALAVMQIGHLLRDHWLVDWWVAHGLREGRLLVFGIWLLLLIAARPPVRRLTTWFLAGGAWRAVVPAAAILLVCLLWPDANREGRLRRMVGLGERGTPPSGAPNLILITIDTWRRDHVALISPMSPPTPNVDALAAQGIVFTNAWAPSPWTLPSLAALQTGLPPRVLRVTKRPPLAARPERLAQIAWRAGWNPVAFVTNPYILDPYLLDRGFAIYRHANTFSALAPAERSLLAVEITRAVNVRRELDRAGDIVPPALAWLRREGRDGPFFLWLHLLDPHLPYTWRELPEAPPPNAPGVAPRRDEIPDGHVHFPHGQFSAVGQIRTGKFAPDAAERRAIAALYAREVQYADAWLGLLFDELRRLGLWENSLIALTADHAEELFDHGGFEHGHSLLPEVTGVPLIVRLPNGEGGRRQIGLPVSLLDLVPTFCRYFDWPLPPERPGVDLGPLLAGQSELPAAVERVQVMENMLYGAEQQAWLAWPWLRVGVRDSIEVWFDLSRDPSAREPHPAPPTAMALADRVAAQLADWDRQAAVVAAGAGKEAPELSPEIKERLKALGY